MPPTIKMDKIQSKNRPIILLKQTQNRLIMKKKLAVSLYFHVKGRILIKKYRTNRDKSGPKMTKRSRNRPEVTGTSILNGTDTKTGLNPGHLLEPIPVSVLYIKRDRDWYWSWTLNRTNTKTGLSCGH